MSFFTTGEIYTESREDMQGRVDIKTAFLYGEKFFHDTVPNAKQYV